MSFFEELREFNGQAAHQAKMLAKLLLYPFSSVTQTDILILETF